MPDIKKLEGLSADDLLNELRAREARTSRDARAVSMEPREDLRSFDDVSIARALKRNQKVIYGTDDRVDVFQLAPGPNLDDVDSVAALFSSGDVVDNGNGTSTLQTTSFRTSQNLCAAERFGDQPTGCFCSGFLVAPDIIATAGHCADESDVTDIRFVFGFRMRDATTAETVISNSEIYRGTSIVGRQLTQDGPDWALVRLDRPVTNHRIVQVRRSGKIGDSQSLHVIGHPVGLPTKFAGGAAVRSNQPSAFFVANLDTYGGNSGSPVFNSNTHEVEGILVRGETDFAQQGSCKVSLVCPTTGCRGEDCTRTTEFANLIGPQFPNWELLDNNPATIDIVADGGNLYQMHGNGRIWKYTGIPLTGWQELDNNPSTRKIAASGGNLYQIHQNGRIWKYTGTPLTGWQELDNNPASVDIVADGGNLYQMHGNGRIWKYTGTPLTGWQELDNNPATGKIAASGGNLYQIHNNGRIWKYTGTPMSGWQELDNNPATVDIVADGNNLYQIHNNGRIWKYTGIPLTGWQELDNNPSTRKIAASGGNLYQIHQNGRIWKYTGTPITGWQELDNNPASINIVAGGHSLYQIHNTGFIWRYTG